MLGWLALIVAALTGLFVVFQDPANASITTSAGLTGAGVVAFLLAVYYFAHDGSTGGFWSAKRAIRFTWTGLTVAALASAAWFSGLIPQLTGGQRSSSSPPQSHGTVNAPGAVSVLVRRNATGQFVAQGQINGISSALMIDTGATAVMLKHSDAEKAGIDVATLTFTTPVQTANGTVYAAPVRVRTIDIGLLKLDDVEALVAKPGSLNENLLGISFLRRLTSYDLNGEFMTLRQ